MSGRRTADDPSLNCACKREWRSGVRDGQAGVEWSETDGCTEQTATGEAIQPASSKYALGESGWEGERLKRRE